MGFFEQGKMYPPREHRHRLRRYVKNEKLFEGRHYEVLTDIKGVREKDFLYLSMNLAGLICKKSADFLFGEQVRVLSGVSTSDNQDALDRFMKDNGLGIANYESALVNAYKGDTFYRLRWGQEFGGVIPPEQDPFRVIIEPQNASFVFPETDPMDSKKIVAYHIAVPVKPELKGEPWTLCVETHVAGAIYNSKYVINPLLSDKWGNVEEWKIDGMIGVPTVINTGIPRPMVVHIPNYSTDTTWEGKDDLTELVPLFDELNNRLTQFASILDKHADPALAVPAGTMGEDEFGNPIFNIAYNKVFEVDGQDDVFPKYITWNGQLYENLQEMTTLVDMIFAIAEIPKVVVGMGDSGTSGSSGLAIKFMMNSLLAKINRKRQYFDRGLKEVLNIAQLMEVVLGGAKYEVGTPILSFQDGLPKDYMEDANVMAVRTQGAQTMSVKTALMTFEGLTEEQAEAEMKLIQDEKDQAVENAQKAMLATQPPADPNAPADSSSTDSTDSSGDSSSKDNSSTDKNSQDSSKKQ